MIIKGVDAIFKELGFSVLCNETIQTMYQRKLRCEYKVNLKVYERKLSNKVSLMIESYFEQGQSTYTYDFYKISYEYKGDVVDVKGSKLSPKAVTMKVRNYINYIEKNKKTIQANEGTNDYEKKKSTKITNHTDGIDGSIELLPIPSFSGTRTSG